MASAPTFAQLAPTVAARLSECALPGYTVARFDRRVRTAELGRVGFAAPTVGARVINADARFVRQVRAPTGRLRLPNVFERAGESRIVLRSAERRFGRPAIPTQDGVDSVTLLTDAATFAGEIVNVWPDKDYVFIRGEDGTDWFSHRRDLVSDADWGKRLTLM